ncbi:MAG: hypothetical protein A2W91_12955 [Bacteroidetes bacterium GWF2_38_335]|nr:MAG: hypothetical protein A2W91_12955 [Bacteroidetes bacterium GWF2_38_335]HBS86933.1 hypothetical protein [Bacteroidales bacterium]
MEITPKKKEKRPAKLRKAEKHAFEQVASKHDDDIHKILNSVADFNTHKIKDVFGAIIGELENPFDINDIFACMVGLDYIEKTDKENIRITFKGKEIIVDDNCNS